MTYDELLAQCKRAICMQGEADNLEVMPATEHHREHMTPARAKLMSAKGHAARWRNHASDL